MKTAALATLFLLLAACASKPEPGSLTAVQAEAEQEIIATCLKSILHENRHVPTKVVWDACHRAARKQRQRYRR